MEFSRYPRFSEQVVEKFVRHTYGIITNARCLVSDIGQNFYLQDKKGCGYIFKISNPAETVSILDAQNQVLSFLADHMEYELPRIYAANNGQFITQIQNTNKEQFYSRLFSFIKGSFVADLKIHPPDLQKRVGKLFGSLDKHIENFEHPAIHRYWHWDLKNVLHILPLTGYISDRRNKTLVDYFLLQFENEVVPRFPQLRQGLIHNDGNDFNLLVTENNNLGLIDFGDMVHSYMIFELAIVLAYLMFNKENPVEDTLPVVAGYHSIYPLSDVEINVLFYAICARLCLSVTMSAYQRQTQPDNSYVSVSENNAWDLLRQLIEINPHKALRSYYEACNYEYETFHKSNLDSLIHKRKTIIGPSLSISYKKPIKIIRGVMQYLFDDMGNTYLDCVNNVCHVGHCHPHVVRAAQKQIGILNTNTRYLHDNLVAYAERLTETLPDPLNICFFVNSGSEANELALRLAYAHTKEKNIIILDNAYHGNTTSLIDISPYKYNKPGGKGPGPYTFTVQMPDIYRGLYKKDDSQAGIKYAAFVHEVIEKLIMESKKIGAFMCESLPGCGGQIVFPDGYLSEVYKFVRQAGAVCIADEVQVGFGRAGSHFWGFQLQGVIPDIVTMGKPIGNGHPLAAVVTTREIARSFDNGMEFFSTFGGNPVSCAVGMAVLDVIESEQLPENALSVGAYFIDELNKLRAAHQIIGDVRGAGLFIGVELVKNRKTLEPATDEAAIVIEKMRERGILISTDGPYDNVLKLKPPMVFSKKNADQVVWNLDKVLYEHTAD